MANFANQLLQPSGAQSQFRLLILGDHGVGKTQLAMQWSLSQSQFNERRISISQSAQDLNTKTVKLKDGTLVKATVVDSPFDLQSMPT